jgi:hypothetical protein
MTDGETGDIRMGWEERGGAVILDIVIRWVGGDFGHDESAPTGCDGERVLGMSSFVG